ncbi:hypothetical protein GCM10022254_33220 [Actinomadura meridiana]|uniref:VWFA domain-containing protein n=1 Tax=Actinomadura meridiana TaxID=559626 RepID=A0ABP8C2W7_9ACTN
MAVNAAPSIRSKATPNSATGAIVNAKSFAPEPTLTDVSILVDESGSLTEADVREEIKAATTIAFSGLNSRSRVSIYGFGSQNKTGQNAITAACPPLVLDSSVKADAIGACVRKLHHRDDSEGADTDHAAALAQAMSALSNGGPQGALKMIFLLTDGRLDVHASPIYGRIESDRNGEALKQVDTQLALARTNGTQVWPLGFGDQIDRAALDRFAAGGSQGGCDERSASKPRARVVHDSGDVLDSLTEAFAAAGCTGRSRGGETTLGAGETRELKINIPIIATDGTITVAKGDPRVRVDFLDPDGKTVPADGKIGDSEFERAGENATVEKLSIVNPKNGDWKVKLTAPDRLSKQLVSATAIWQGAVSSSLVVDPPSARVGQPLTVRLSLVTRRGAITDAKALSGLTFTVQAQGPSLGAANSIVVRDDGRAPDDRAGDGRYAGTFDAPPRPGDLTFTGVVSGYGVRAEKVPVTVAVTAEGLPVQGRVAFSSGAVVHPGGEVRGKVTMENKAAPARGRLVLEGSGRARATLAGATDLAIGSGTTTHPFTVRFPPDAGLGGTSLTVKVVDAADPSKTYAVNQLTVTVKNPPGWLQRHWHEIAGVLLLLLLVAFLAYLRRRARRARVDVRGLRASLRQDGEELTVLKAPGKWAPEFRFVVHDSSDGRDPGLDYPHPGDRPVRARRGAPGKVVVQIPDGPRYEIEIGTGGEPYEETGLMLAFTDVTRRRSVRPRRTGDRAGDRARTRADATSTDRPDDLGTSGGRPDDPGSGTGQAEPSTTSTSSTYNDPWL